MRVLAFEDTYDIEAILTAGGLDTASMLLEQRWNSTDALHHIERFKPDILLLDHYMPPESGMEVLDSLLTSLRQRPTTIVAMSSEEGKNQAMVQRGADIGIVKFDLASLPHWTT